MTQEPDCRLFAILARESSLGVILRRGPTDHVLCVRWDRARDTFEEGQWLKGRIYERRCDLSPSGERLLYFAAKWNTPLATWTAVSKPPWFTAVALWPKGDAWGGGGLFDNERLVSINTGYAPIRLEKGKLPPKVEVRPLAGPGSGGEDFPLYHMRLVRDGWREVEVGVSHKGRHDSSPWIRFDPAIEYARPRPGDPSHELRMRITGIKESGGPWWMVEHDVVGPRAIALGRTEWADWDRNGDLLFAREGVLFRVVGLEQERELVDLRDRRFVERAPPESARRW